MFIQGAKSAKREGRPFVVAIGDSQIRTLAYSKHVLSFFLGPAIFNNCLTEKRRTVLLERLKCFAGRVGPENHILFYLSGDVVHHWKDSYKTLEEEKQGRAVLAEAAEVYVKAIAEIQKGRTGRAIIVRPAPNPEPSYTPVAEKHYQVLKELCQKYEVDLLDPWPGLTENNVLKDEYVADFAHLSHRAQPHFLRPLLQEGLLSSEGTGEEEHHFADHQTLGSENLDLKIWGDYDPNELILEESKAKWWRHSHAQTKLQEDLMADFEAFLPALWGEERKPCLAVGHCREGYPAFLCNEELYDSILGIDAGAEQIRFAQQIATFTQRQKISFIQGDIAEVIAERGNVDVVLNFRDYDSNEGHRLKLFEGIQPHCKIFFFVTFDGRTDKRLLKKVGFTHVFHLPFHKSLRGDFSKYSLLCAYKGDPPAGWVEFLQSATEEFRVKRLKSWEEELDRFSKHCLQPLEIKKNI